MKLKIISSLEKCFLDENILQKNEYQKASMLKNEIFHLGICYQLDRTDERVRAAFNMRITSPLKEFIKVNKVCHVPVHMPVFKRSYDGNYLRTTPGLYPDLLVPMASDCRMVVSDTLQSLFIELAPHCRAEAGVYPITVEFFAEDGTLDARAEFEIEIIDALLPKQKLINTQWFHCDCLQVYYGTEAFDERHWQIIENFMATAVKNGMNMILTPIFTPPLDTEIGGERPTTQLVDITVTDDGYTFGFENLGRWIDLCDKVGIEYLEIAHFFTQWGAQHAPKIVAKVDGQTKKIFGWETDSCSEEYAGFLRALIPAMLDYLKAHNGADRRCWFHISDEPKPEHLEQYNRARKIVAPLLEGYPIIDALSNYEFYEQGVVEHPVPSSNHIEPFLENNVPDLWTYYCCGQGVKVSNRFIAMPSARTRVMGLQMFKYNIAGFLQWGYNFYYNQRSHAPIDPYLCTDGEYFGQAGDEFRFIPHPTAGPMNPFACPCSPTDCRICGQWKNAPSSAAETG